MVVIGYALAALVGLSLGLLGGGGSILTVPIFVYVLGYDAKLAIAMSLPVIGVTSLVGAASHWRAGNVNIRTAVTFGLVAMVGAYGGAQLARLMDGAVQLALLAGIMLIAAVMMYRSGRLTPSLAADPAGAQHRRPVLLVPVALAVGVITGVVGIGGGFLVVPALVLLARAPMTQAVGTSLLVIAMNSAAGFAGYVGQVEVPWAFMMAFTGIAVTGILAGTYLVRYVSPRALKQAFALFLIVMGSFMLYRNRAAFMRNADAPQAARAVRSTPHVRSTTQVTLQMPETRHHAA